MLAGGAPLRLERLAARGAPATALRAVVDRHAFYDTSSYGPVAVEAIAEAVGARALVHGFDRPVLAARPPTPGPVAAVNPRRLLGSRVGA